MATAARVQQTVGLFCLAAIFCLLVESSEAFSAYGPGWSESHFRVEKKRGNMDLAFIQMYQFCDLDRNGHFSPRELRCLSDMLNILLGGRS